MLVDHAFAVPMQLLWPARAASVRDRADRDQHGAASLPSPARCYNFGQALGRAIAAYPGLRVVVIGTGGLSHQLDGTRAGFINKEFDLRCMDKIVDSPEELTTYSAIDLVREAGAQGAEFIMWLAMRGALTGTVRKLHSSYHIPISNTAAGVLLLENSG